MVNIASRDATEGNAQRKGQRHIGPKNLKAGAHYEGMMILIQAFVSTLFFTTVSLR